MSEGKKSGEDSEEERRLFYVAVTRAGKKLFLTFAVSMVYKEGICSGHCALLYRAKRNQQALLN